MCSDDLANKRLAFQLIDSLQINFNWKKYLALHEWLMEGTVPFIEGWEEEENGFSAQEEAIIRVFNKTSYGTQHKKLKTWDRRVYLLPNLKALNFHSNQFEEIPKSIKQLSKLEALNLNKNQLTVIGKELDKNHLLESLSLGHNSIYAIHIDFKQLKNLNHLDLAGNELTELPKGIGGLSYLRHLNLNNNPLKILPKNLNKLINLEKLYLLNTQITKEVVDNLKTQLPNCNILYSKK